MENIFCIDEYNECFPVSEYLSIKYEGTRFNGWIPSYHLSMPRLFSKFDSSQYVRGLKIFATSWQRTKRRNYRPEYLGILANQIRTVRNFTLAEFANHVHNLQESQVLFNFPSDKVPYYFMLTGIQL